MTIHSRLMAANGGGDPFDRHVFACVLAIGVAEAPRPLPYAVGLSSAELARLVAVFFPEVDWLALGGASDAGPDSPEEADLRRLLEDHATRPNSDESRWLAAMVARRSLRPSHLWQDLGLAERGDLSRLLHRHFEPLAARNTRDMKWKKFFYRTMCEQEGLLICKSPVCDDCADFGQCFGPET